MILGFHCWGPGSTLGRGTEILQAKKQNKKTQAPYTGEWDPPGSSLSMEFSMQEYWSGLPCPPPGDLPDSGIKPEFLISSALAGWFFTTSAPWEAHKLITLSYEVEESFSELIVTHI